jgi:hypothetical protein
MKFNLDFGFHFNNHFSVSFTKNNTFLRWKEKIPDNFPQIRHFDNVAKAKANFVRMVNYINLESRLQRDFDEII